MYAFAQRILFGDKDATACEVRTAQIRRGFYHLIFHHGVAAKKNFTIAYKNVFYEEVRQVLENFAQSNKLPLIQWIVLCWNEQVVTQFGSGTYKLFIIAHEVSSVTWSLVWVTRKGMSHLIQEVGFT